MTKTSWTQGERIKFLLNYCGGLDFDKCTAPRILRSFWSCAFFPEERMAATTTVGSIKQYFRALKDPRVVRRSRHLLVDIIVLAICGVIADCDDWSDIVLFAQQRLAWFQRFLRLPGGIPSHDTFARVFAKLEPRAFGVCCLAWLRQAADLVGAGHIAIDGKTLRGAAGSICPRLHPQLGGQQQQPARSPGCQGGPVRTGDRTPAPGGPPQGRSVEQDTRRPAAALSAHRAAGHPGVAGRPRLVSCSNRSGLPGDHGHHLFLDQAARRRGTGGSAAHYRTRQQIPGFCASPGATIANPLPAARQGENRSGVGPSGFAPRRHHRRSLSPRNASAQTGTATRRDDALGPARYRQVSESSLARRSHHRTNIGGLLGLLAAFRPATVLALLLVGGLRSGSLFAENHGHRNFLETTHLDSASPIPGPSDRQGGISAQIPRQRQGQAVRQ